MRNHGKSFKTHIFIFCGLILVLLNSANLYAANDMVRGYEKPEVCMKTNIRCVLKKQGETVYWCLKSAIQRNLDARRSTTPIKKTYRENLGHCAKIIPVRE